MEDTHLCDWSKEEKFNLYKALKTYGSNDIVKIQEFVSNKTSEQIVFAINHYKEKLKSETGNIKKKNDKKPTVNASTVPLANWTKVLSENFDFKELQTETAASLRLIAQFENLPNPSLTEKVDFKKVYHLLASSLEGKALSTDDKLVNSVIKYCLVESALTSKQFLRISSFKCVMDNINFKEKEIPMFAKVTDNCELAAIWHLVGQKAYNPLHISERYLRPSVNQNNDDDMSST